MTTAAGGGGCERATYREGSDYWVVAREPGAERADLPVWETRPGLLGFDERWERAGLRATDLEAERGVPGAALLHGVLSPAEAAQLVSASEAMGYTADAPLSLGRHIR